MSLRPPAPIGPEHDVAGFDCGVPALNLWLRQGPARGDARAAIFVAAEAGGRVAGFYTLAAGSLRSGEISPMQPRGAPEPVLKLGRLAVDRGAQGRGIGTALVMNAFARAYAVSRHAPVAALMADAADPAAGWLRGLGFRAVPGDATALFVPLGTIEALVEGRG